MSVPVVRDALEMHVCWKCDGSGLFADCFDDLCHGREECIHGDPAICSECQGDGEVAWEERAT